MTTIGNTLNWYYSKDVTLNNGAILHLVHWAKAIHVYVNNRSTSAISDSQIIGTLPEGYRPTGNAMSVTLFNLTDKTGVHVIEAFADGNVIYYGTGIGAGKVIAGNGMYFRV